MYIYAQLCLGHLLLPGTCYRRHLRLCFGRVCFGRVCFWRRNACNICVHLRIMRGSSAPKRLYKCLELATIQYAVAVDIERVPDASNTLSVGPSALGQQHTGVTRPFT